MNVTIACAPMRTAAARTCRSFGSGSSKLSMSRSWKELRMFFAARRLARFALFAASSGCAAEKAAPLATPPTPQAEVSERPDQVGHELTAEARDAAEVARLQAAADAYLDAHSHAPLSPDNAKALAAALKLNGDRLVATGPGRDRGLQSYAMAVSLTPDDAGLATALVDAALAHEHAGAVLPEVLLGERIDQMGAELSSDAKAAFAGVFIAMAEKLLTRRRQSPRVRACLDRAVVLDPDRPALAEIRRAADATASNEEAAANRIKAEVDAELEKHPDTDGIATVAKRHQSTRADVMAALDVANAAEQQRAASEPKDCGAKPSCGVGRRCKDEERLFGGEMEVVRCSEPQLVVGKCWVTICEMETEEGANAEFEITYKLVNGKSKPVSASLMTR